MDDRKKLEKILDELNGMNLHRIYIIADTLRQMQGEKENKESK